MGDLSDGAGSTAHYTKSNNVLLLKNPIQTFLIRWDMYLVLCASGSISIASALYLLADRNYLFRCIVTTLEQREFVTGIIRVCSKTSQR